MSSLLSDQVCLRRNRRRQRIKDDGHYFVEDDSPRKQNIATIHALHSSLSTGREGESKCICLLFPRY